MFSLQTSFPHISICKNTHIFKVHFPPKSGAGKNYIERCLYRITYDMTLF